MPACRVADDLRRAGNYRVVVTPTRPSVAVPRVGVLLLAVVLLTTACGEVGGGVTSAEDGEPPPTAPCPEPVEAGSGAGAQLPDITLACLGQPTELSLRGLPASPVVLNFWASWCGVCRKEMPEMQQVADAAGDQVLFLGVNVKDGQRQARFLLDDLGMTYPNLYDEEGRSLDLLPSPGVPTTLVLAPDGEILDKAVGAMDMDRLRTLLTDRLGVRLAGDASAATD